MEHMACIHKPHYLESQEVVDVKLVVQHHGTHDMYTQTSLPGVARGVDVKLVVQHHGTHDRHKHHYLESSGRRR